MSKYFSFFKIRVINGLQYRAAAYAGVATQFAWGGMTILMFRAFYNSGHGAFPMTFQALSTYIWLQQALLALFMAWYFDNEIFESIRTGSVAYELCRPMDLYTMWFTKNMATRFSRALLRSLPILVVAAFLPDPFGIRLPATGPAALLFLPSLILGFLVMVAFTMLIYIGGFYTISPLGLRILAMSVIEFFSGAIIPLPFFPEKVQQAVNLLPFASMQNAPYLIYTGYLQGTAIGQTLAIQALWLLGLVSLGHLLMDRALKRVVVQGG